MSVAQSSPYVKSSRLLALDVFRGLTVALMILVNSPGNKTAYSWLMHSSWHGCTLADFVFPFFIFMVGISLSFTLTKARTQHASLQNLLQKICKRSIALFLIGLALNLFPHFDFTTLRFFGVLQRIAICYFVASLLFLTTKPRTQLLISFFILIAYWIMMTKIAIPVYGANDLSQTGNVAAFVDRLLFSSSHLYGKVFDPEGLLSTLPAIATALLGNLTGIWLLSVYSKKQKLTGLYSIGALLATTGWIWGIEFPINKALWTSSYVLWTGGMALLVLALCYWLIEIKAWQNWTEPFKVFGTNAMLAYVLHVFFLKVQAMIVLQHADGSSGNLKQWITDSMFGWAPLPMSSLLYAFSYTGLWLAILWIFISNKKKSAQPSLYQA
ncbi:acyltransferase family protein [Legionella oakridgensis]|uniref:Putative Heparan-alpha-glucosaminide N-acetyltransferase n=1 Tax=Legionella oakridgensis TaxID=29423 RepID=A0A0W0XIP7_9GAMM|nr:heparan-alpha-glucosaminide N-acetyltransferase domain-containing protein [Legionella oakridgensis]ETO93262.1 hypothetical protein LOR_71c20060 [Legionella oakridgensis RV-2-2007]KTD44458.1 putative Heparan-alpha-glucosaminide N-acetyltransferase [Legionella oakridgensis]STY20173.1 Putative heparan-alpha-glucosaminide N-acetyltransferase [Legionella longbeachae]